MMMILLEYITFIVFSNHTSLLLICMKTFSFVYKLKLCLYANYTENILKLLASVATVLPLILIFCSGLIFDLCV